MRHMAVGDSRGSRRQRVAVIAVLSLMLIAVITIVLVTRDTSPSAADPPDSPTQGPSATSSPGTPQPTSTSSPTPSSPAPSAPPASPAPPVTTHGAIDDDAVQELVDSYVVTAAGTAPDDPHASDRVAAVAGDTIIAELEADLLELDSNGWTRTGTPEVISASVIDQDDSATPPTATVQACIDSSDVHVIDSAGDPLPSDPSSARALNLYTLNQQDDGSWILVSRSFPDNPAC